MLEVDHIVPIGRGGDMYDPANLQTLCRKCHIRKHRRVRPRGYWKWRDLMDSIQGEKK